MKILTRTLSDEDITLFDKNPKDYSGARLGSFILDLVIAASVFFLIPLFNVFSFLAYFAGFIYGANALLMVIIFLKMLEWSRDVRKVPTDQFDCFIVYGSSAIDWPFGKRSIIHTIKNLTVFAALSSQAVASNEVWFAVLAAICFVLIMATNYLKGVITLNLIDRIRN